MNGYDDSHVVLTSEYEIDIKLLKHVYESTMDVVEKLFAKVSRIIAACKYQKKLLQICDDKVYDLKREIIRLKPQLQKVKRIE